MKLCSANSRASEEEEIIADPISDLVTEREAAKSAGDTAYVVFLDGCRAFYSFPKTQSSASFEHTKSLERFTP